ncbi:hypothetical protein D3C87_1846640 [compost metagenome]
MLERLDRRHRSTTPAPTAARGSLLGNEVHRPVEANREDFLDVRQVGIFAVMQEERPIASQPGRNRQTGFRMQAHFARKREQLQRLFKRQAGRIPALGQR